MPKNCQKSVKFSKNGMGGKIWVKMVGGGKISLKMTKLCQKCPKYA